METQKKQNTFKCDSCSFLVQSSGGNIEDPYPDACCAKGRWYGADDAPYDPNFVDPWLKCQDFKLKETSSGKR